MPWKRASKVPNSELNWREARAVRDTMRSLLDRVVRRFETPAQREARLAPLRQARDALLAKHGSFCRCKNSKCLKRYCLCFERGVPCGDACKCENCENVAGSAALREARAAIGGAAPWVSRKRCHRCHPVSSVSSVSSASAVSVK